jgi:Fusaric acid resistance protein-like
MTDNYASGPLRRVVAITARSRLNRNGRNTIMSRARRPSWLEVRAAVLDCGVLAIACLVTYWLATYLFSRLYFLPMADELLGGLWAVIATVFVYRFSYYQSTAAAVSRMAATLVSFALCLIYLILLPFHPLALAALIGASALAATLIGRPGDAITAGITTAVVMVSAAPSAHDAWQQPILRLADTIVGVAVGVAAAWLDLRVIHSRTYLGGQSGRAPADVEAPIRVRRWPADVSAASAQVGPQRGRK